MTPPPSEPVWWTSVYCYAKAQTWFEARVLLKYPLIVCRLEAAFEGVELKNQISALEKYAHEHCNTGCRIYSGDLGNWNDEKER